MSPPPEPAGCVAQRESTSFTPRGSQVQSLSHPPFLPQSKRMPDPGPGLVAVAGFGPSRARDDVTEVPIARTVQSG